MIFLAEKGAEIKHLPEEERCYVYRILANHYIETGNQQALLKMLDQGEIDVDEEIKSFEAISSNALPDRLLHTSIKNKQEEIALSLIERGSNMNIPNWHWTPMGLALSRGCFSVVRALHARGIPIIGNLERKHHRSYAAQLFFQENPFDWEKTVFFTSEAKDFVKSLEKSASHSH